MSVPGLVSQLGDAPGCSTSTVRPSWTESAVAPTHVSLSGFFSFAFSQPSFSSSLSLRSLLKPGSVKLCDVNVCVIARTECVCVVLLAIRQQARARLLLFLL